MFLSSVIILPFVNAQIRLLQLDVEQKDISPSLLDEYLKFLKLSFMRDQHQDLAAQASKKH